MPSATTLRLLSVHFAKCKAKHAAEQNGIEVEISASDQRIGYWISGDYMEYSFDNFCRGLRFFPHPLRDHKLCFASS